ncbi:MAG TPA: glycosyltransferase family 4 protein [Gaiellaceae bacterium]|nr:glycosyltransferase family 4 protein [Gaiellaceae bacterium]
MLVLNQYYWPGVEATAFLLHDLCRQLTAEFDVTVVTGMIPHPESVPGRAVKDGVEIVRVNSTSYDRRRLSRRAFNYVSYLGLSLLAALRAEKPDVVLCMTDPPIIADIALVVARRFHAPLVVISQDVFPEIAVELRRLENPVVIAFLRALIGFYLRRADRVVAIGETMRDRLETKGAPRERIRVIPNWVDANAITPMPRDNPWAREYGLDGKFVVMHSGNIGHAQNLDALVRSATFLRDLDDLAIVMIGGGARRRELEYLTEVLEVPIQYLPYQPRELLSQSLSGADIHVVGLAKGLSGFVVPSRLYGVLAAGRPVIVAAEATSETAQLVERVQCGVVVPPGRPEQLALAIRDAHDGMFDLEEMGRRSREFVVAEADRSVAYGRYSALLHELVA